MSSPTSDIGQYLPGSALNGSSVSLPQTVKLIAAFVDPSTNAIVAPPVGGSGVIFAPGCYDSETCQKKCCLGLQIVVKLRGIFNLAEELLELGGEVANSKSRERLIYVVILIVDVVIIAVAIPWVVGWFPRRTIAESPHLSYGDKLPFFRARDINGEIINLHPDVETFQLLFLIDPNHEPNAEEKYRLDYLNTLVDKYGDQRLPSVPT